VKTGALQHRFNRGAVFVAWKKYRVENPVEAPLKRKISIRVIYHQLASVHNTMI
jgi:hypothetical protein